MALPIPIGLQRLSANEPEAAEWLRALPHIVAACARDWSLSLRAPYDGATVSWVASVSCADAAIRARGGTRAVLKVTWPHPEAEHEGDALAFWDGVGAVRLLAQDRQRGALLLQRCEPGRQLWDVAGEDEMLGIAAGVFAALWCPAPEDAGFPVLFDDARRWERVLPERWERLGRPWPRTLLDEAVSLCAELTVDPPAPVLCHQDAHGGNMLRNGDGWVVIDPKPIVAEPAFDLASALRDRRPWLARQPHPERIMARRLDRYVAELGVDRARARGWGIVHALAWGTGETTVFEDNVACAQLLAAV
jgi:streptomycin 6-kinase